MERMATRSAAVAVAAVLALSVAAHAGGTGIHKVVMSGEPAAGLPGVEVVSLDSCNQGFAGVDGERVAYAALVGAPSETFSFDSGLWTVEKGQTRLLALKGQNAAGLSGLTYLAFPYEFAIFPPVIRGEWSGFVATVQGAGVTMDNDTAAFVERQGVTSLVIREGDQMPGLAPGTRCGELFGVAIDAGGNAALRVDLVGEAVTEANNEAILVKRSGVVSVVVREGQQAPGTPAGTIFGQGGLGAAYQFSNVAFADNLDVVFTATLSGPNVTAFNDEAVYQWRHGVLTLLLREGDAAPGCQPNVTLGGGSVSMLTHSFNTNRVGGAAFFARIGGGSVPTTQALFSTRFGLVWPEIMPGTTTSDGREFGVVSSPFLSDNGRLVVLANLRSAQTWSPMGVWFSAGGEWHPVIEPGDAVPDRPGVTITGASLIHGHAADGTIVFSANITRAGGSFGNAIFRSTPTGGVETIAMDGDVVNVPGVGVKTVSAVSADMDAVSDTGVAAFRLHFTDGTTGHFTTGPEACSPDFDGDGDAGTDADIEAFFACLGGNCCTACGSADFNADGDSGTDADIEAFFRTLSGGSC